MKRFLLFCCAFISVIAVNNAKAQSKADQDAAMKAWQAYMTPGDVHKMIAKDDGEWKAEVTSWMAPDAPPTKSPERV